MLVDWLAYTKTGVECQGFIWALMEKIKIHALGIVNFILMQSIQFCAAHSSIEISQLEYPEPLFYRELISLSSWWPSSSTLESVIFLVYCSYRKIQGMYPKEWPKNPSKQKETPQRSGGGAPLINDRRCCITHYTP